MMENISQVYKNPHHKLLLLVDSSSRYAEQQKIHKNFPGQKKHYFAYRSLGEYSAAYYGSIELDVSNESWRFINSFRFYGLIATSAQLI